MEHTKGPWSVRNTDGANWPGQLKPVVAYTIQKEAISLQEMEANARLIASAPDLLAELENLAMFLNSCVEYENQLENESRSDRKAQKHRDRASEFRRIASRSMALVVKARGES